MDHLKAGHDSPAFKWYRPFCFYHLKAGPDFFLTSLDRFGINKIFFMTLFFIKRSKLVTIRNPDMTSGFRMIRLSNGRDWHKVQSESQTVSGFRMGTVYGWRLALSKYCI